MRVAVFPADQRGCGWYRLLHPARVLADQGHDVTVHDGNDRGQHRRRYADGRDVLEHVEVDADVLVFQRVIRAEVVEVIAQAKAQGLTVVVDVDDDLDALHAGHPYQAEVDGSHEGRHGAWLHEACGLADLVTVTTAPLAERYAPHGRFAILPNLVPEAYLAHRRVRSRRVQEPLLVGWTGRPESHVGDASVMGGRVGPVVVAAGARFAAWGPTAPETFCQVGVPRAAGRRMPYRDLRAGFPQQVGKLDVGLVPLLDTGFNRAKSWLKGIEYGALGVPFVASPLPEYVKLAGRGAGWLARSPEGWAAKVEVLLGDARARSSLAEAGREAVRGLTYEAHAGRWWDAWSAAHGRCGTLMETGDALSVPG